jgi:hypothetical protein
MLPRHGAFGGPEQIVDTFAGKGFTQEEADPHVEAFPHGFRVVQPREHHDGNLPVEPRLARQLGKLKAIQVRHANIHEQPIDFLNLQTLHGFPAILDHKDFASLGFQHSLQ